MIPYVIALVGSYLIGESMQSEKFADGGSVSGKEYQIKKPDGTFFYIKMQTGSPAWSPSADMAYQYTKDEAEKIKSMLENQGATGLSVVKYDKDWWKNAPDEFAKGGKVKKKYAVLRSPMGEIIADIQVDNEDKMEALKKFRDMGINEVGTIYYTETPPHYYAKGGVIGDAARVKSKNKTGVIMKILKPDDVEQFSDIKREKHYVLRFVDGTQDTYSQSEIEIYKN